MAELPHEAEIEAILAEFDRRLESVRLFRDQLLIALQGSSTLEPLIHSISSRIKDRDHLRDKLYRKAARCDEEGISFPVTPENLLTAINDLAGIRLLHLHTRQIEPINLALCEVFGEQTYDLREGPFARTWDDESREFFRSCGIETQESPTMYTSVHYVVGSASRTTVTCEIQVRTLAEELWGEVDHSLNYPTKTDNFASAEQLKVLARVTSSTTRLVDSIFLTHERSASSPAE